MEQDRLNEIREVDREFSQIEYWFGQQTLHEPEKVRQALNVLRKELKEQACDARVRAFSAAQRSRTGV